MGSWEIRGDVKGMGRSWRDNYPELAKKVVRIKSPLGRNIAWEGTEIWAYKDRPKNVVEAFKNTVKKYPEKEAYFFHPSRERMTWKEVSEKVNRMAYRLRHDYGFKKGDKLCLLTLGSPEYIISYLSIITLGGIAVPVNLGLSAEGTAAQIKKVEAKGLLVSPDIWEAKVNHIIDKIGPVEVVYAATEDAMEGTIPVSTLYKNEVKEEVSETIDEWDLISINFTSGTTGAPKGTMNMHINSLGCAQAVVDCGKWNHEDVILCMAPLYHNTAVYTNFLPALYLGAKMVVMSAFVPTDAVRLIGEEKCTATVAAPVMLTFMMNQQELKKHDVSSFKKIMFGGHAASESFIRQLFDVFNPIAAVNGGSVSESTATGFMLPTEDAIRKITSCGLAAPNAEIAIFDDDGYEITEPNKIGEVGYKGQQTNAGYYKEPERTRETFRKDGYVLSGDWAKLDEERYLWLLDRKKDMIVRGGQNVYCIEVENKIYQHGKVMAAAVVGVPDHMFAERVKAVIVQMPGQSITRDEIREHCKKHLAPYEVPEYVVFANALPRNPAGKTLKPPLVDFWGDNESNEDQTLVKFQAYCESLPSKLLDMNLLKIGEELISPRIALRNMQESTELGKELRIIIANKVS